MSISLDNFRLRSLKDQLNEQAREEEAKRAELEAQKLKEKTKTEENKGRRKPKNK